MLKNADLKIYLKLDDDTRAERIYNREGGDLQQIKEFTKMRDSEDSRRYMKLYGIDNSDLTFADLVIDTKTNNPEQIVKIILDELKKRKLICEE